MLIHKDFIYRLHCMSYASLRFLLVKAFFSPSHGDFHVTAYCDSDWVSFPTCRQSTSCFLVFLGGSLTTEDLKAKCCSSFLCKGWISSGGSHNHRIGLASPFTYKLEDLLSFVYEIKMWQQSCSQDAANLFFMSGKTHRIDIQFIGK